MLFSLEALNAKFGDSLLLHYGTQQSPKLIVIDGGPRGVYSPELAPRLKQLKDLRAGDDAPLPIRMVMVSHVDADHIQGILEMTEELLDCDEAGEPRPYKISTIWHNSFDDLVKSVKTAELRGVAQTLRTVATGGEVPAHLKKTIRRDAALVLASIDQGRVLRGNAVKLGIPLNQGFQELILAPESGGLTRPVSDNLSFNILGPRQDQLDALQNQWAKTIAARRKKGTLKPADLEAAAAAFVDKSVYNLSSIVVLAKAGGKSMLLTGDARGDYILEGLEAGKLKKPGKPLRIDLMKVPHHGSVRNVAKEFFEEIIADHYVISADGKHDNPDLDTMKMLLDVRGNLPYTIYLTNHVKRIDQFLAKKKPSKVKVVYATAVHGVTSFRVDLGETLNS